MSFLQVLGNIVWFLFYGIWSLIAWCLCGLLLCVTLIGIPFGIQCFKIGGFSLVPFGKDIDFSNMGGGSVLMNVIWIIFFGWELALANLVAGLLWCVTIVGIPFGLQCFKMMKVSLLPFGARIIDIPKN